MQCVHCTSRSLTAMACRLRDMLSRRSCARWHTSSFGPPPLKMQQLLVPCCQVVRLDLLSTSLRRLPRCQPRTCPSAAHRQRAASSAEPLSAPFQRRSGNAGQNALSASQRPPLRPPPQDLLCVPCVSTACDVAQACSHVLDLPSGLHGNLETAVPSACCTGSLSRAFTVSDSVVSSATSATYAKLSLAYTSTR